MRNKKLREIWQFFFQDTTVGDKIIVISLGLLVLMFTGLFSMLAYCVAVEGFPQKVSKEKESIYDTGMKPTPYRVTQEQYDAAYRRFRDSGLNHEDSKKAADITKIVVEKRYNN